MNRAGRWILVAALACAAVASGLAELSDKLAPSLDHPAIEYFNYLKHPAQDVVAGLKGKIESGRVRLKFDGERGYLPSVLRALNVPVESQLAVFSRTSLQAERIEPDNPRTIFFNDSVAVGWVHGGFIEMAAQDPQQGVIFYTLEQQAAARPNIIRRDDCLRCHSSDLSLGVPGMIVRSFYTMPDGRPRLILGGFTTDHRSPFEERWGGWYVTGMLAHGRHMGNAMVGDAEDPDSMITDRTLDVTSLKGRYDTSTYLSPYSDLVALLVFDHQMHMMNLITRVDWEVRCALYDKAPASALAALFHESAKEFVDYLLFIDEAPLPGPVQGVSGFAQKFGAEGPSDSGGRSLRQFELKTRIFRYPCSYMIYSKAFESLPEPAKDAIYQRMWQVLSGEEKGKRYARLSLANRQAIVEILRQTKQGLPSYFQTVTH
ncbi:MAG TPA: hypothetical protein VMH80_19155 [Bryobacteraceae bacterium]|nr:hypothetical protein [Bryobacteraceae bacterium]